MRDFRLTQSYTDNTQEPTALMRQGNFTEFPTLKLIDPLTGLPFTTTERHSHGPHQLGLAAADEPADAFAHYVGNGRQHIRAGRL